MADYLEVDPAALRTAASERRDAAQDMRRDTDKNHHQDWMAGLRESLGPVAGEFLTAVDRFFSEYQDAGSGLAQRLHSTAAGLDLAANEFERTDTEGAQAMTSTQAGSADGNSGIPGTGIGAGRLTALGPPTSTSRGTGGGPRGRRAEGTTRSTPETNSTTDDLGLARLMLVSVLAADRDRPRPVTAISTRPTRKSIDRPWSVAVLRGAGRLSIVLASGGPRPAVWFPDHMPPEEFESLVPEAFSTTDSMLYEFSAVAALATSTRLTALAVSTAADPWVREALDDTRLIDMVDADLDDTLEFTFEPDHTDSDTNSPRERLTPTTPHARDIAGTTVFAQVRPTTTAAPIDAVADDTEQPQLISTPRHTASHLGEGPTIAI